MSSEAERKPVMQMNRLGCVSQMRKDTENRFTVSGDFFTKYRNMACGIVSAGFLFVEGGF